ncbi:hypothetical protein HAX54_041197 [Datura stramonium]|uniref:Uncharacterized protein n=1 Tax=Datura stramonium TaxID=4076 RepID=A0ABS8SKS2_DATST|nr:hypothetical protein [Datura stramonium]
MDHMIKDCPLLKEEQRKNSKKQQELESKAFKKTIKATRGETSNDESEGGDGENNMVLMSKNDIELDNDSSEENKVELEIGLVPSSTYQVSAAAQNEGTLLKTDSLNVPSESRKELRNSGGTNSEIVGAPNTTPIPPMSTPLDIPSSPPHIFNVPPLASMPPPNDGEIGSFMVSSTAGSSDSSMKTAHSSISPEDESAIGPSSPQKEVDLSSLIVDIRGRYVLPNLAPLSSSPNWSSWSPFSLDPKNVTVIVGSSPKYDSADDLVPLADLKKGAQKWVRSTKGHISASNVPCISGPTSHT